MVKVKKLGAIKKKTEEISKFVKEIDEELGKIDFDASDPESIETTLQEFYDAVNERTRLYENNDWIQNLARKLKRQVRKNLSKREVENYIGG